MRFEVKTRNAKGGIDYITVEAADRSALFAELKAKNVTCIQVTELKGDAKSKAPRKLPNGGAPVPGKVKGLVALVVVCVIGAVVFLSVSKDKPKSTVGEKRSAKEHRLGGVKPDVAAKSVEQAVTNVVEAKPIAVPEDGRMNLVCTTNKNGEVKERWTTADGKKHMRLIPPKPAFDNVVDQALSIALTTPPGVEMPPMPSLGPNSGDVFADALKRPIEIKEDDPENLKRAKLLVISGRELMLEELRSGKRVEEVIADHCRMWNDNVKLRQEASKGYRALVAEGDLEGAEIYRAQANQLLERAGADPIPEHGTGTRNRKER